MIDSGCVLFRNTVNGLGNTCLDLTGRPVIVGVRPEEPIPEPASGALALLDEYRNGTDPNVADTDGDGVSDGQEAANGTNPLDTSDWRAAEWYVLTAAAAQNVPVANTWWTSVPAGMSSLVVVFSQSEEYPHYTEDQSQYNDILEWLVSAQGHTSLYGEIDVNSHHDIWEYASGFNVAVQGFGPVCVEGMGFFSAPTNEALSVQITLGGVNISDAALPSTLVVGVFPLELAQGNMPAGTGIDNSSDSGGGGRALIPKEGVAYVTGAPAAPGLAAQIKGLPWFFDVMWNFSIVAEDWGIIILYNGAGGVPHQSTSMVSDFQSPWEYIPATGAWVFHQNSNSYATRIVNEMNSTGVTE